MLPRLIQGGMGAGVSGWKLAREVSSLGHLGVVSGTALDSILVRRLGRGDPGGHVRRAMSAFPSQVTVQRVLDRYFHKNSEASETAPSTADQAAGLSGAETGKSGTVTIDETATGQRFTLVPLPRAQMMPEREKLLILANFVEVYLAKEGHAGVVGINYLHKIQFPILPSLYGAMIAGVDVVLMGAGIPGEIPGVLDRLSQHMEVSVALDILDSGDQKYFLKFDPARVFGAELLRGPIPLGRPRFIAIVSSATLARALLKKAPGGIDGFVVEAPTAGGHNAPPRGVQQLTARGEPIYGERDSVDMKHMTALGVPFWLAGGYATRERLAAALAAGAQGVQLGTAFAFCEESDLDPGLRRRFLEAVLRGEGQVFTDPAASPTGFPFKVIEMQGTLSDQAVYAARPRLCDLGYLRRAYRKEDGTVGYRCPGEPVEDYVFKGGKVEETVGRKCLCNALVANIGLGQRRADGYDEPPLLTAGDDLECLKSFIATGQLSYRARDVVTALIGAT